MAPNFPNALPTAQATRPVVRGELAVYGCGGTGVNIVRPLETLRGAAQNCASAIVPYYLDTSVSNFQKPDGMAIPAEFCIKYDIGLQAEGEEGVDGSGGLRATNHDLIKADTPRNVRNALPKYAAAVVCSASGGSGSLIAPYLVKEILKTSDLVFVFLVGDRSTDTRARNTNNTIQSLEGIARTSGKTIAVAYYENTVETPRSRVDEDILRSITLLSLLTSRQNGELDTMDLRNFVQHHKVNGDEPHIARLYVCTGVLEADKVPETIVSVATLTTDADDSGLRAVVPHACMGVMPPEVDESFAAMKHVHFLIDPTGIDPIVSGLKSTIANRKRETQSAVRRIDLLADANANDDGVVV